MIRFSFRFSSAITIAVLLSVQPGISISGVYDDMLIAVKNDDNAKVIALIQRGMDVNTADQHGTTLTMFAARAGNESLLKYLLDNGANILIKNRYGDTALMLSALHGHLGSAKLLSKAGAEINPDDEHWAPLHYAAFAGKRDIAAYLIEKGASVNIRAPNGLTPLMLAARNGHELTVRLLLDSKADTALRSKDGKTAAEIAVTAKNTRIAETIRGLQSQ